MNCAGVILAAGASSRMGQPKAFLLYRGETFLDRLIGLFGERCSEVVVVVRSELDVSSLKRSARFVTNEDPERGMLSSLQCGLAAVSPTAESVLFCPVDYAPVEADSIRRIVDGFNGVLTLPTYKGKRGHPCMISLELAKELSELPGTASAKQVIHGHLGVASFVPVQDNRTVEDIDDPAAYSKLLAEEAIHVKG